MVYNADMPKKARYDGEVNALPVPDEGAHGRLLIPGIQVLAQIDEKMKAKVRDVIQDYPEWLQKFMLVRWRYRTHSEACRALGVSRGNLGPWLVREEVLRDLEDVSDKLVEYNVQKVARRLSRIGQIALDEAEDLISRPWDAISDRMAAVKGRLIVEILKGASFIVPTPNKILLQQNNFNYDMLIREVTTASERAVLEVKEVAGDAIQEQEGDLHREEG